MLRKVFRVCIKSLRMVVVSLLDLDPSISTSTPANSELNSCFANVASLCKTNLNNNWLLYLCLYLGNYFQTSWITVNLCQSLQRGDEAAVLNLNIRKISNSIAAVQRDLSILTDLQICSSFLQDTHKTRIMKIIINDHANSYLWKKTYSFSSLGLNFFLGEYVALLLFILQKSLPEPQNVCTPLTLSCVKTNQHSFTDANPRC